ncbi:NUDIX hydrolase [Oceanobacillus bengalensis]|nr:NUDIX hydrolase [Oceanobacillus bengalensis]
MVATPKPASTVVLLDDLSRVYLTQRPKTMKFMGGFHVFPGGSIEKHDSFINKQHVNIHVPSPVSLEHYIGAARELFEEVGILLGDKIDGSMIHLLDEKAIHYRQQLITDKMTFNDLLEQENIRLDLQTLTYIGQLITPERSPIRFDTRFFVAHLPSGQLPIPDKKEIDEAFWITPEKALTAFENNEIMLAFPTILTLKTIINYQNGSAPNLSFTKADIMKLQLELKTPF